MGCDFKPGDEVVCVDADGTPELTRDARYTILESYGLGLTLPTRVIEPGVTLREVQNARAVGYRASRFRKVERRNDSLSIESFLTIKPGFEEPRKAPAKKREKV
jgi:hypothetical protein